jgi:hypothetical protein
MTIQIAMYRGPATKVPHKLSHALIKWWFKSPYSHSELVIGGVCWTASYRDGGVRAKVIDLHDGKWDLFPVPAHKRDAALAFLQQEKGKPYDQAGVVSYVLRFVKHNPNKWFCFEICARALGYEGRADRISPQELVDFATKGN